MPRGSTALGKACMTPTSFSTGVRTFVPRADWLVKFGSRAIASTTGMICHLPSRKVRPRSAAVFVSGATPTSSVYSLDAIRALQTLRTIGYLPFLPPNVGGYPKGDRLLGPHQLVHAFDLLSVFSTAPDVPRDVGELFARLGIQDPSSTTRAVVTAERDPRRRLALAIASPEYTVV